MEAEPEIALGLTLACLGRRPEPPHGGSEVPLYAESISKAHCEIVLRALMTRDGSAPVPLHGEPDASAGPISEVVAGSQVELRANMALRCRCSPEGEGPAEISTMAIPTEGESVAESKLSVRITPAR